MNAGDDPGLPGDGVVASGGCGRGWTGMKDATPKRDGWYLVHVPTGRMGQPAVLMAWWAAGEGWKGIPHVWSDAVAHWMKMPTPPSV